MKKLFVLVISIVIFATTAIADPWLSNAQTLAADADDQYWPAVAYNSTHDEYLVVWQADVAGVYEVRGVRVDAQGLPIGSSFAISDPGTDQFQPDVVYDAARDRYFVVWVADYSGDLSDTDLKARFIPASGPSASYLPFGINSEATGQWNPAVALSPGIGEFMIVWSNIAAGTPAWISAQRWAADGSGFVTPVLQLDSGSEYRINPKVAWNDETSQYLVVYERFLGGLEEDVFATRLTWAGSVLGSEFGIAAWPGEENEIDVTSCRGDYMVVWKGGSGTDSQVYARAVSGDGTVGAIVSDLSGAVFDHNRPSVACNESGAEYLVSWEAAFNTGYRGVVGALLELDGAIEETFNIYVPWESGVYSFTRPGLVFGAAAKALVAWESDRSDLTSQDIRGRLVGGRLFADDMESGDLGNWTAVQQ